MPPAESAEFERPVFLDGPATDMVEIQDDVRAKYLPGNKIIGGYGGSAGEDLLKEVKKVIAAGDHQKITDLLYSREFVLVSTFACVLRTLGLFERKNILGRPLAWQFSPGRLVCQPRLPLAEPDARYQRQERRIFFSYSDKAAPGNQTLYLSLSREAVAHETAHAIVDGINPHLYTAFTPHSLALHESLADLTALLVAIKSETLMKYVMDQSGGSLDGESAFSRFAENIGRAMSGGQLNALRSFSNKESLAETFTDCYQASTVLSGAVWDVICQLHAPYRDKLAKTKYKNKSDPQYSASGEPLADLARRLRTVLYRALDILPGGDISLADYGRAVLLADRIQFGADTGVAQGLTQAFLKREIFRTPSAAEVECPPTNIPAAPAGGWAALLNNEQAARDFVNKERAWLGIPDNVSAGQLVIERQPCIHAPQSPKEFIEVKSFRTEPVGILRVLWPITADTFLGRLLWKIVSKRISILGTTVIIDIANNGVLARLSNASSTKELYPDQLLRLGRQAEIDEKNKSTGLFLDSFCLQTGSETSLAVSSGTVKDGVLSFSGHGVSLKKGDQPTISIDIPVMR